MSIADPPSAAVRPAPVPDRAVAGTAVLPRPRTRPGTPRPSRAAHLIEGSLLVVAGLAAALAVALRFVGPKALWLDETLTVNIARLPLPKLFEALRHDGSPPAYYLLLHFWLRLFGSGTQTVRVLAGLLSLATLPAAWALGRAVGGRRVALALVIVLACNPFALRYGTENRMYSLVMLLATLAALTLIRCLQRPTVIRLFLFGLVCGFLLLTHYWALFLVAGLGAVLALVALRGPVRTPARMALAALCGGCLLFLPWAPSFYFQATNTGTPWADAASPMMLVKALGEFAGWETAGGMALFVLYLAAFVLLTAGLVLVAVRAARPLASLIGWRGPVPGSRWAGPAAAVAVGTMLIAVAGGMLAGAAFAYRYASVVLPLVALLVALGVTAVRGTRFGPVASAALLVAIAVLGTSVGAREILGQRTQAPVVAAQIVAAARPGDVVAFCPDQLGPAVSRLLPDRLYTEVTFPRWDDPERINWVDYAQINGAANVGVFARQVLNLAGSHQIWLVWESGYRTLGYSCQELRDTLEVSRPAYSEPVHSQPRKYYEHESLVRFAPA